MIKVLYDNEALEGFKSGWGVSYLIDDKILFDAGDAFGPIWFNLEKFDVGARLIAPLQNLESIVISHTHEDHAGGLWEILKRKPGIKVYVCPNFQGSFKQKITDLGGGIVEVNGLTKISDGIYSTGELPGKYKGKDMPEQSLVITVSGKPLSIVTGCAHPGIIKIIEQVKQEFPDRKIDLVMGGFHLYTESEVDINRIVAKFRGLGVLRVAPCHCTGKKAVSIFKKEFQKDFFRVGAGSVISL